MVSTMQSTTPCEHDWVLVYEEDTWSGPKRLSVCSDCRAFLREWLTHRPGAIARIPLPRHGSYSAAHEATSRPSPT